MDTERCVFTRNKRLRRGSTSAFVTCMRVRHMLLPMALLVVCGAQSWAQAAQSPAQELARVLRDKQIITASEFDRIVTAGSSGGVAELAAILREKGVITTTEADSLNGGSGPVTADPPPKPVA